MSELNDVPLIVAFVADLMFTTRIQTVVDYLGWRVEWVETAVSIGTPHSPTQRELPGESLYGFERQAV